MTELIACVSSGKGTWEHVAQLIAKQDWEKVYLITNDFGIKNFKKTDNAEFIEINADQYLTDLTMDLTKKLKTRIQGIEVAVNLISGSGKEHMAVLAALLKLGVAIRLVALTPQGVKEV